MEQDVNKDEQLRDRESEDGSEEFTGDGTVDRKGNIARRQKTGGWRAAPLIFGMLRTSSQNASGQGLRFSQCRNMPSGFNMFKVLKRIQYLVNSPLEIDETHISSSYILQKIKCM